MFFFEVLQQLNKLKKPISAERLESLYALVKEKHGENGEALLNKVLAGLGYLSTQNQANPLEVPHYSQITAYETVYNHSLYQKLLPLCQLAYLSENNGLPEEHAFKLSIIFNDAPKAISYLFEYARLLKSKDHVLHDACLFNIPTPADCAFPEWRLLAQKNLVNPRFQELFPFAPELEDIAQTGKKRPKKKPVLNFATLSQQKKELEQACSEYKSESTRHIPRTETVQREARQAKLSLLGADIGKKQRELTRISQGIPLDAVDIVFLQAFYESYRFKFNEAGQRVLVNNGIPPKDIARFERLVGANDDKLIPNIILDGEALGYPGLYLKKLDTLSHHGRALSASLGKITRCCQYLGGLGDSCTIHGISSPTAGFYVVCRGDSKNPSLNDPIIAQSWAWRGRSQGICLDSIERSPDATKEQEGIINLYRLLGHTLCSQFNVPQVNTGSQSGISAKVGLSNYYTNKENFQDYAGYCDSKSQLPLANQAMPYLFYGQTDSADFQSLIVKATTALFKSFFSMESPLKTNEVLKQALAFALEAQRDDLLHLLLEEANNSSNPHHKEECKSLIEINQAYYRELNECRINLALIQEGACLNMFNKRGRTALHIALTEGMESFKALLALKPNLNIQDMHGNSPLLHALERVLYKNKNQAGFEFAKGLIEAGAELDIKDHDEATPLILAVKNNDLAMVIQLHKHGADLETFDDDMKTALYWAVEKDHQDIFNYLIQQGTKTNISSYTEGTTLLMAAIKNKNMVMVKTILANPASTKDLETCDQHGKTALFIAAEKGSKEIFDCLVDRGAFFATTSKSEDNVLMAAISSRNNALAEGIFAQHPEFLKQINHEGETALMRATRFKSNSLVRAMVESPFCNIDASNERGKTALYLAVEAANKEAFECLLNKGASSVAQRCGNSLLVAALLSKNKELVELIFTKYPEMLNQTNSRGLTPLINAVYIQEIQLVQALLASPAFINLDVCNLEGKSALFLAAEFGNKEIFDCLANRGASFAVTNTSGENVLMAAIKSGNKALAEGVFAQHPELSKQINVFGETALMMAISFNYDQLARAILASPFCSSEVLMQRKNSLKSENALFYAVKQGEFDLVELILNHPNASSLILAQTLSEITPLCLAVDHHRPDIAQVIAASPYCTTEVLLQYLPDGMGIFSKVALSGQVKVVKAILANPHCTSAVLLQNPSILFNTIFSNKWEITQAILESKPMNSELFGQKDTGGNTILMAAAMVGDTGLAKLICASPHCNTSFLMQENKYKLSAMILALTRGYEEIAQAILASPDCQDETRQQYKVYSLLNAVSDKDFIKVQELVEEGELNYLDTPNFNRKTALSIAADKGLSDIFNYLVSKGANINGYLMEPIINFMKATCLRLEENKATPEIKNLFQSYLNELQEYLNQPREGIVERQDIYKKLYSLVVSVHQGQNKHSFFSEKNSVMFQEYNQAVEKADKRSLAYSAGYSTENKRQC